MRDTGDLGELAGLIHFRIGAWQDFGYAEPPSPDCATIPPLGQRSARAVKAGYEAVRDIDQLIARLREVRAELAGELHQDSDIRMSHAITVDLDGEHIRAGQSGERFRLGQPVTVTDGGWTGTVERISNEDRAAYVRFPGRPDLVPYAFEALQ